MGHVIVPVQLSHPERSEPAVVADALVDTGASWTTIPRALADELGLRVLDKVLTLTANNGLELDHSYALMRYGEKVSVSDILISDTYPGVLLGVVTLEGLRLAVDPANKRLVDADLLLL